MIRIVGLDLSLTSTGWARSLSEYGTFKPPKDAKSGYPRIDWILRSVLSVAAGCHVAVIEGYSYGSAGRDAGRQGQVVDRAELGGVIRWALWRKGIPVVDVAPATLKKYALGVGRGDKTAMVVAAGKRLGYPGYQNDESDALWLWNLGAQHYGVPGAAQMPLTHFGKGAHGLPWPDLTTLN